MEDTLLGHRATGCARNDRLIMTEIPKDANTRTIDGETFVICYTDGSTIHGKSPLLARSGNHAPISSGDARVLVGALAPCGSGFVDFQALIYCVVTWYLCPLNHPIHRRLGLIHQRCLFVQ